MSVIRVHERVDEIERGVRRAFPTIKRVISHPSRRTRKLTDRSRFGLTMQSDSRWTNYFVLTNRELSSPGKLDSIHIDFGRDLGVPNRVENQLRWV